MEILATIPAEQPKKYLVTFSLSGGAVVEIEAFSDAEAMKKAENLPISEILKEADFKGGVAIDSVTDENEKELMHGEATVEG